MNPGTSYYLFGMERDPSEYFGGNEEVQLQGEKTQIIILLSLILRGLSRIQRRFYCIILDNIMHKAHSYYR